MGPGGGGDLKTTQRPAGRFDDVADGRFDDVADGERNSAAAAAAAAVAAASSAIETGET